MTGATDTAAPRSASTTAMAQVTDGHRLDFAADPDSLELMARVVRVMFPHDRFGDGPYRRSAAAILEAGCATPALRVAFATALHDLQVAGFAGLGDGAALAHLREIEGTGFFKLVRSTAIVTLYNDPEAWEALGYEGPSYHKGGYLHRGFDDLDWLPEPRIDGPEAGR